MTAPLATVIVVTYNSARWRGRMLAALEAQTERAFRLVIVDNASHPDERPSARALPAGAGVMQCEANIGFAAANNLAAQGAETPYLVFLNPDAFPEPDWLARLIAAAEAHANAGAVGSTQMRADAPGVFDGAGDVLHASGLAYRALYGKRRDRPPPLGESFAACGAALLARRAAFEAVGGFDPRFFCFFEDVDLCFRMRLLGWRVLQAPDAVVAHVGGGAGGGAAWAEFYGARNRLWCFVKNMPAALFWPLLPLHVLFTAAAATAALVRGRGTAAWRGLFAGVAGLAPAWRARRAIQSARRVSWRDIAAALAWNPLVFIGRQPVIRRLSPAPPPAAPDPRPVPPAA